MAGQSWLDWAVDLEEAAGCDIQAGPDVGPKLVESVQCSQGTVTDERLVSFLPGELAGILSAEEIEAIATQPSSD